MSGFFFLTVSLALFWNSDLTRGYPPPHPEDPEIQSGPLPRVLYNVELVLRLHKNKYQY